jgi:putative redox protein
MELVLLGMGACTAYDVVHILRKARQDVRGCRVELDAERAETPPQVFTKIHVHFIITGKGITPAQAERAVQLSAEKYCSASIMLGKTAAITHDFVVEEAV